MSIIKAEKAVRRHLLTLSPQLPTAYEAIPFTAPTGMYQRLQFVVNPPTDPTFGNYYHRENIQVQIFVADKLDVGTTGDAPRVFLAGEGAGEEIKHLKEHFRRGLLLKL